MPSELPELYDRHTYYDLRIKVQLKSEEKLTDAVQFFESVGLVISRVLGGKSSDPPPADPSTAPQNFDQLEASLAKVLG